jgi:hypothetical protein
MLEDASAEVTGYADVEGAGTAGEDVDVELVVVSGGHDAV